MTWIGESLHVARKSVLHSRWVLLAYAIALGTASVLAVPGQDSEWRTTVRFAVLLAGAIAIASFMQDDSPVEARAIWRSVPLRASTVFGAKIILLLFFGVLLPVLAQSLALVAHGITVRSLPPFLAESWVFLVVVLLTCFVAGATTSSLKTFVVTVVALPILGVVFAGLIFATVTSAMAPPLHWLVPGLVGWALLMLGMVLVLYLRRDTGHARWFASVGALVAPLLAFADLAPEAPHAASGVLHRPTSAAALAVRLVSVQLGHVKDSLTDQSDGPDDSSVQMVAIGPRNAREEPLSPVSFRVHAEGAAFTTHDVVTVDSARFVLPGGRTDGVRVWRGATELVASPDPALAPGLRWLDPSLLPARWFYASIPADSGAASATVATGARWTLHASVVASVPVIVATIPFTAGASFDFADCHYVLGGDGPRDASPWRLRYSGTVHRNDQRGFPFDNQLEYALVNRLRGEAMHLTAMVVPRSDAGLVLPGPRVISNRVILSSGPARNGEQSPARDDAWLRGAQLVVFRWVARAAYPVRAEYVVP